MATFIVVLDQATGEVVDVLKRDDVSIFPFGAQQFGPTPGGRPFPQIGNANNVIELVQLDTVRDGIRESPFLNDAQRAQFNALIGSYIPGDRIQLLGQSRAVELGLVSPAQAVDAQPPPKPLIPVFIDP